MISLEAWARGQTGAGACERLSAKRPRRILVTELCREGPYFPEFPLDHPRRNVAVNVPLQFRAESNNRQFVRTVKSCTY